MKLTDDMATVEHILRSIDAMVVFHNIMMAFFSHDLPDSYMEVHVRNFYVLCAVGIFMQLKNMVKIIHKYG